MAFSCQEENVTAATAGYQGEFYEDLDDYYNEDNNNNNNGGDSAIKF